MLAKVTETVKEKVTATPAVGLPSVQIHQQATNQNPPTTRYKEHKTIAATHVCFLCLFVASFLLRGEFSFLLFVEAFLIFLEPGFEIL